MTPLDNTTEVPTPLQLRLADGDTCQAGFSGMLTMTYNDEELRIASMGFDSLDLQVVCR